MRDSLELVVAPLCAYFAERAADGVGDDASVLAPGVDRWFDELERSLEHRPKHPVRWREDPEVAPVSRSIAVGFDAARLLAAHVERPDLEAPDQLPGALSDDRAWDEGERTGFQKSHYGQLLVAECWLPGDFDYTFRCPRPDGEDWTFGSLAALRDQLTFLRRRSVDVERSEVPALAEQTVPSDAPFLRHALRGLAILTIATDLAIERSLPLSLRTG